MSNDGTVGLKLGAVNLPENTHDMFTWTVVIKLWHYNSTHIHTQGKKHFKCIKSSYATIVLLTIKY